MLKLKPPPVCKAPANASGPLDITSMLKTKQPEVRTLHSRTCTLKCSTAPLYSMHLRW